MNTVMPTRFNPPDHYFKEINDLYSQSVALGNKTGVFRYYPFVVNKRFFSTIIDAIFHEHQTVTVERWNVPPPHLSMGTLAEMQDAFVNPQTQRIDIFPAFMYETISTIKRIKTKYTDKVLSSTARKWIQDVTHWEYTRKKESITITLNEALNLLYQVLDMAFIIETQIFERVYYYGIYERTSWQNLSFAEKYISGSNKIQGSYRKIPKEFKRMRFAGGDIFTKLIVLLSRMFKTRFKRTLNDFLRKQNKIIDLNGDLVRHFKAITYYTAGETFSAGGGNYPKLILDSGYFYICDCCQNVENGNRKLFHSRLRDFITTQTKQETQRRVLERQKDPAKYSDDDAYRTPPPTEQQVAILLPFEATLTKNTKGYLHKVTENVHSYLLRLNHRYNNPNKTQPRLAQGGWGSHRYIDAMSIDHWKWDRIEVPIPKEQFKPINYLLKNGNIVLCQKCYDFLYLKYKLNNGVQQQATTDTNTLTEGTNWTADPINWQELRTLPPMPRTQNLDTNTPVRMVMPRARATQEFIETILRDEETPRTAKPLPQVSNPDLVVIKDHKADPLKTFQGFYTAKNEHKQCALINLFDTKGNNIGTIQKDNTLYLGVEIEVTPSELSTNTISKALENVAPNQNTWRYFYTETKYLSAMITKTFFDYNHIAIVKHDGTTANGFEIVSVPGTHKWHIEEAWKGFFAEDYEDERDKIYAPASWLCGWANNGGKSNNPIYKYGAERELGAGHRPICGIHIHASRDAMTPLTVGKLLYFMNAESNQKFIEKFAGRTSAKFAKVYSKPVSSGRIVDTIKKGSGNSADYLTREQKYEALNINTGKPTIEFRIFRSNVTKVGFMRYLDFVHALITWCSTASCSGRELNVDNFMIWCNTQRGTYKYLTRWLVANKYLSVIHEFNPKYHSPILFEDTDVFDHKVKKVEVA